MHPDHCPCRGDGDQETDEEPSLPFVGRLPSWAVPIAVLLVVALFAALVVTPLGTGAARGCPG